MCLLLAAGSVLVMAGDVQVGLTAGRKNHTRRAGDNYFVSLMNAELTHTLCALVSTPNVTGDIFIGLSPICVFSRPPLRVGHV